MIEALERLHQELDELEAELREPSKRDEMALLREQVATLEQIVASQQETYINLAATAQLVYSENDGLRKRMKLAQDRVTILEAERDKARAEAVAAYDALGRAERQRDAALDQLRKVEEEVSFLRQVQAAGTTRLRDML